MGRVGGSGMGEAVRLQGVSSPPWRPLQLCLQELGHASTEGLQETVQDGLCASLQLGALSLPAPPSLLSPPFTVLPSSHPPFQVSPPPIPFPIIPLTPLGAGAGWAAETPRLKGALGPWGGRGLQGSYQCR